MDTRRILAQPVSICLFIIFIGLGSLFMSACGQAKAPTPTPTQLPVSSPTPELPTGTAACHPAAPAIPHSRLHGWSAVHLGCNHPG